MPLDYRITVYTPSKGSILANDASADAIGIQYEDTPTGCGAGKLTLGMYREDATSLGYYDQFNLFEVSSGDMRLTTACASGATKVYLDTTEPIDATQGEDNQILYFFDGANLTMRVPVISIGSDGGGVYANIGAPDGVLGNPSTLPAYGAGCIVGRRRYMGRLALISTQLTREPTVAVTLIGLSVAWSQAVGSVTVTTAANIDVGVALYTVLEQFQSTHWPFFTLSQTNFPTTGFIYADTLTTVSMDRFISDALGAIPNADAWYVRVGHDLTPRLVRCYNSTAQTYTWTRTLAQGVTNFEAQQLEIDEENISNVYNAIQVTGGNAVGTGQPVTVQVTDPTSITDLGFQIDGTPVSNTAINTIDAAAAYGAGLLAENSIASAANTLLVWTDDDAPTALYAGGPIRGDVLRALACIKVTGFDKGGLVINECPDSAIQYGSGPDQLWTSGSGITIEIGASPDGQNAFGIAGAGGGINSVPVPVVAGQTWTISGWANTTGIVGGGGSYGFLVRDATTLANVAFNAAAASHTGTTTPTTFTIPVGTTAIVVTPYVGTHAGATGVGLFAQPNLTRGSVAQPYVQNLASPNVFGLPTSIVTTIDLKTQTSKQEAQFAAIEPDWAAYTALRQNAAVTALLANKVTSMSLDRYAVSKEARGFTTSTTSLNLGLPSFLAQFATGATLVSVPAQSVALEASQTNYVWILPSGTSSSTVLVQQTPTTVDNAILFGYFTCSSTGIIGSFLAAPVGVFATGTGSGTADFAANYPTPTWTGTPSVTNGASLNGVAADVVASIAINNAPTDGSVTGLAFYYRQTGGSGRWIPYGVAMLALGSGSSYPAASQTVPFEYGDLASGTEYDFAVAYYGSGGYGTLAEYKSAFAAVAIGIPAGYLLAGSLVTPTTSSAGAANGTSGNGVSADVIVTFTTSNQPTDGSLSRVQLWTRVSGLGGSNVIGGTGFAWSPYGEVPAVGVGSLSSLPTSGSYTFNIADLTNGQSYDFGISYRNVQGAESAIDPIVTSFAAQALNIPTGAGSMMPTAIAADGPDITAGTHGTIVGNGSGAVGIPITFSIGDWAVNNAPGWFAGFGYYWRQHGSTISHSAGRGGVTGQVSGLTQSILVPAAIAVDIGISYLGAQSTESAITWSAYLSNISTPLVSPPGTIAGTGQQNMVPDGQLAHILSAGDEAYWAGYLIDGLSFYAVQGNSTQNFGLFAWKSGANGSTRYANSQPFTLTAGVAYTMSAYIDLIGATGSGGCRVIGPITGAVTNTNPSNASGSTIASISVAGGSTGSVSYGTAVATFTPTTTGLYVFQVSNYGITVGSSPIFMGQFQVELGSAFTGFKNNTPVQTDPSSPSSVGTSAIAAAPAQVQATITSTSGAEGSFLASATVARRSIAGNTTFNFLFNPTAAQNTQGWATADSTGHAVFRRDTQWGGRFIITCPSGSLSGYNALYYQTVTVVPSTTYTCSGNLYCNVLPSGGSVNVDAFDGTTTLASSTVLTTAAGVLTPFSFTFTTGPSTTAIEIRLIIYTGGTSPTASTSAAFSSLKLEYGTVSTPHSDDTTTSLVTTTHQQTPGTTDNSNLLPGIVSARHMVGAPATDQGAVLDSSGLVLMTRHAAPVTSTIASAPGADGLYLGSGTIARRQNANPTAGTNFVFNPSFAKGTSGWTLLQTAAGHGTTYTDGYGGGRLGLGVTAGYSGLYNYYYQQNLIVASGGIGSGLGYVVSGVLECDSVGSGSGMVVDIYDGTSTLGQVVITAVQSQTPFSFTFTASSSSTIYLRCRVYSTTGNAVSGFFYALKVETGSVASDFTDHQAGALVSTTHLPTAGTDGSFMAPGVISARHMVGGNASDNGAMVDSSSLILYARHAPAITGVINSSGLIPTSGALAPQSSTLPTVSNLTIVSTPYSSATSYGNYGSGTPQPTYSKIVASWSAATVYFPSGATLAIPAGSQTFYVAGSSGVDPLNHLTPSQSYYLNAWASYATGALTLFYTPNSLTVNEAAQIFADGQVTVVVNDGPVTTPAQPGSGSSSGGTFTPPPPTCPAIGQIVQTKRGFIRAEDLDVGDELLDWDDGVYNLVRRVSIMPAEIFRVVAGTEEFRVDRDHKWVAGNGRLWWPTHSLRVGDRVTAADGGEETVTEIESLGEGEYVGIDCERHRFRMGRLIAHNVFTGTGL